MRVWHRKAREAQRPRKRAKRVSAKAHLQVMPELHLKSIGEDAQTEVLAYAETSFGEGSHRRSRCEVKRPEPTPRNTTEGPPQSFFNSLKMASHLRSIQKQPARIRSYSKTERIKYAA